MKEQIFILCDVSASGETIPPMQIFPGMRLSTIQCSIVLMGSFCIWLEHVITVLWLDYKSFHQTVVVRPAVLIVNGHSSHIDLFTSNFARKMHFSVLSSSTLISPYPATQC